MAEGLCCRTALRRGTQKPYKAGQRAEDPSSASFRVGVPLNPPFPFPSPPLPLGWDSVKGEVCRVLPQLSLCDASVVVCDFVSVLLLCIKSHSECPGTEDRTT